MVQGIPARPSPELDNLNGGVPPDARRVSGSVSPQFRRTSPDGRPSSSMWDLERVRHAVRGIIDRAPTSKQVWLPSFIGLGAADIASVVHRGGPLLRGIEAVGLPGAAGLLAVSVHDLKHAETMHEKMDAGGDVAWGVQGLLYLSSSAPMVSLAAVGLGLAGAATQTTVGVMRIKDGIVQQDLCKVKLGALDFGGGLLWIGWDLLAWEQPLFIGGYVLLMVSREAYASRAVVETWPQKAQNNVRNGVIGACAAAVDMWDETGKWLNRAERGAKRWALRQQILADVRRQSA